MGDLQVIGGLRDKRAELVALVGRLEQQLADHRVSLTHLDATLRLFDPNLLLQPDSGPQQRERVSWFRPGECLRAIYDVLRDSPQPLTTRDVAGRVIAAKGITVADDPDPGADPKDHPRLAQPGEERDRAPGDGWRGQLAGVSGGLSALPVSAEIDRGRAPHRQSDDAVRLFAVADAAQVLAPGCLLGIAEQVGPGDVMMVAEFGPAQSGEVGFCPIGAGTTDAVTVLVIDTLHGKAGMQRVPGRALIGMKRRSL